MADNSQSRTARRKQKKSKKKPLFKRIMFITGIVILALVIGVGGLFTYYIATAPDIDASKLSDPFSSKIYDKDGELIADLGAQQRTKIGYDDLPQVLIDAVVATEDSRFFEHPGIDIWRIGGAIVANITDGFGSEGASTITQQVVEKAFLSHEKKIKIKVQEQWLALKLEQQYSKKQILEMYLNKVYYGSGAYGVAKAAQIYFGKTDLNELTLPEAAILAGLPQRPSGYNPFQHPELTKKRMNTVLHLMVMHDKITKEEAEEAKKVDIPSLLTEKKPDTSSYEAFIQRVKKEVEKKVDGADIYTDGLKVYTTIDTDIQEHVEFLLSDSEDNPIPYPEQVEDSKGNLVDLQAGMVVMDTNNGAIRAIGGARNGIKNGGWNYAIDGKGRQPGSTIKPILSYGPVIENKQWSTYHQINDDKPFDLGAGNKVDNWNNKHPGWITMRTALADSLNVPALKTFGEVGKADAKKFAEGLGINIDGDLATTDAIGGAGLGVTPLELAGAYRAFGNEGIYNDPYSVTKVVFPDDREVDLKPKPKAAMSDYTAYMITDMLKSVMDEGTGYRADIPGLPVAGKTGTTNFKDKPGSPDSWFSGYTTNYTISAWVGYGDQKIAIPDDYKVTPQLLFKNTMTEISQNIETADFKKPSSVVEVAVEKGSNPAKLPSDYTPESKIITELFVKGHEPSATSEKYDKLDPVSKLKAKYDKDANSIKVGWEYDEGADVSFNVSASVNGGQMQSLSSTEDTSMEISNVEPGAEYEIQVVVVSNKDEANTSEAQSTKVKVSGDEEDEEEDEGEDEDENGQGNVKPVSGLTATYKGGTTIDVSWKHNGPPASFEVIVTPEGGAPQKQTVNSNGIKIDNAQPGTTYIISVTPIGKKGANSGVRGEPQSKSITVPTAGDGDEGNRGNEDTGGTGNDGNTEQNNEQEGEPDPPEQE